MFSRNLYKAQKLLSVGVEGDLPLWRVAPGAAQIDIDRESFGGGLGIDMINGLAEEQGTALSDFLPALLVISLAVAAVLFACRCYRSRARPRRKRVTRLRRLMAVLNAGRTPTV